MMGNLTVTETKQDEKGKKTTKQERNTLQSVRNRLLDKEFDM